jgi:hypothetical protein
LKKKKHHKNGASFHYFSKAASFTITGLRVINQNCKNKTENYKFRHLHRGEIIEYNKRGSISKYKTKPSSTDTMQQPN